MDPTLTLSQNEYIEATPLQPDKFNRPLESDASVEFAISADFTRSKPDLQTIRKRAVYRSNLDFHCLPPQQRFVILTTCGPDDRYDVEYEKEAIRIWGVFETKKDCEHHIRFIRSKNPHAVFIPMHVLQLGRCIQIPPPNDGSTEKHHVNENYGKMISSHLKKEVDTAEFIDRRHKSVKERCIMQNQIITHYNSVVQGLKDMLKCGDTKIMEETKVPNFPEYVEDKEFEPLTPGNLELDKLVDNVSKVPAPLVEEYLKVYSATCQPIPEESMKREFKMVNRKSDGKPVVVSVIYKRE